MMTVEQANARLAALISRLHTWLDKDASLRMVTALRAGDPHATFLAVCAVVTEGDVTLPARLRHQVHGLGEGLGVDRAVWSTLNFYLAA